MRNKMMIYGCGGAGSNIAQAYLLDDRQDKRLCLTQACMVDTSDSNLLPGVPKDRFHLIGTKQGSGGMRVENAQASEKSARDIVKMFAPGEINIVVASASGGSGNIIAAYIHRELIQMGRNVISLLITDQQSLVACRNSLNTLATYDGFAKQLSKPFVTVLYNNQQRIKTDRQIHEDINHISLLFSGDHLELDNTDLRNFLDYTRTTKFDARIASLRWGMFVEDKDVELSPNKNPVTLAMLHSSSEQRSRYNNKFVTSYLCEGFLKESQEEISYLYSVDFEDVKDFNILLNEQLQYLTKEVQQSEKQSQFDLVAQGNKDDSGLVL